MTNTRKQLVYTRPRSASHKIFSLIAVLALFLIIPVLVYLAYRETNTQSHASPSTTLAFSQTKLQVNPGDTFSLDITLNPGNNVVFLTNLVIDYDSSVIKPTPNGILANTSVFPATIAGPNYNNCIGNQCSMSISLSVGNPTQAIQKQMTIATVNFQTVGQGVTTITFDQQTKVFSIASSDQANENVLSSTTPTTVFVGIGTFPSLTQTQPTTITPTLPAFTPSTICHYEKPEVCPQVCVAGKPCPPPCDLVWVCPNPSPTPTAAPACTTRAHDTNVDIEKELVTARQHIDAIEKELDLLANNKMLSVSNRLTLAKNVDQLIASTDTSIANDETQLKPSPTPIPYSGSSVGVILSNILTFLQNIFPHSSIKK